MKSRWTNQEKEFFYRQLLALLYSGMSLDRAVKLFAEEELDPRLSKVFGNMATHLSEGKSLSSFMQEHQQTFTAYESDMVETGEKNGNLEEILERLAEVFVTEEEKRQGNVNLWYAIITGGIGMLVLFAFIFSHIIDAFERMFQDMNLGELPSLTAWVIDINDFFNHLPNVLILLAVIIVIVGGLLFWRIKRRENFSLALSYIPWLGSAWTGEEAGRLLYATGNALQAGVPEKRALLSSAPFALHSYLRSRVSTVAESLAEGKSWSESFQAIRRFPPVLLAFISLGESKGDMASALLESSRLFGGKSQKFSSTLADLAAAGLGVALGFIIFSLFLPIFSLVGRFVG